MCNNFMMKFMYIRFSIALGTCGELGTKYHNSDVERYCLHLTRTSAQLELHSTSCTLMHSKLARLIGKLNKHTNCSHSVHSGVRFCALDITEVLGRSNSSSTDKAI